MILDKVELWVHDNILKNETIRHAVYAIYQRILWFVSPKLKSEGNIIRITPNDGYEYLFGYYDKCPWDPSEKYILALKVKNSLESADSREPASIVIIDAVNGQIQEIAKTRCWNVQQGCMAQWYGMDSVLYNDYRDGSYCSIILNINNGHERIIDMPVYAISQDQKTALTLDFSRLHRLRPGYGYCNLVESTANDKCPDKPCIWKIDLDTGKIVPLLKYTDFANLDPRPEMQDAEHKVNHLMISPDNNRFMVLHRWFKNGMKYTRLVTCNMDGTDIYNLSDNDFVSHCCWKNANEILAYLNKKSGGKGYYLLKDQTNEYKRVWPELVMDGHPTYSPDGSLVVTDTYPNRKRIQSVYIIKNTEIKCVARVFSPFKYSGDVRVDLHPRWSRDGKRICIESCFEGKRGLYVINLNDEVEK
ncbi:MAG: TolB family protein [Caldicoprobacterales bacterium]